MRIRTTRQAQLIRAGIDLARTGQSNLTGLIPYPLMERAYTRTKNKPPAGDGQLRVDHPDRKNS